VYDIEEWKINDVHIIYMVQQHPEIIGMWPLLLLLLVKI